LSVFFAPERKNYLGEVGDVLVKVDLIQDKIGYFLEYEKRVLMTNVVGKGNRMREVF
jgi:hypothetical protein